MAKRGNGRNPLWCAINRNMKVDKMKQQCIINAFIVLQCIGCGGSATMGPANMNAADSMGAAGAPVGPTGLEDGVAVVLVNTSDFALDVQFHVATDPEAITEAALFASDNAFLDGIGFLSLGILAPGETIARLFDCTGALILGTAGGAFLDDESGESIAEGSTVRFAALGPQFACGSLLTFEFIVDDEGRPLARLTIE